MPEWLSDDAARRVWIDYSDIIHSLGLLESLDAIGFAVLCDGIAALLDMRKEFERDGNYTNSVGENGALQVNPLCQLIAQQTKGVLTLASEFGMTPRGRITLTGSLSCNPDPGAVNPMEQLLREVTDSPAATPQPESAVADVASRKRTKTRRRSGETTVKAKPKQQAKRKPKRK